MVVNHNVGNKTKTRKVFDLIGNYMYKNNVNHVQEDISILNCKL